MTKANWILIIKSLFPVLFFFTVGSLAEKLFAKYTIVGPVDHESGQPMFESFSSVLYYGFIIFGLLCFIYSVLHMIKIKGWPKYFTMALVALFLPLQYLYIVAIQIMLFGK